MKKFTLFLAAVLCAAMSFATDFVKVTAEPTDWSGEYILVYEASNKQAYVWTGVDAGKCYTAATITDNKVSGDDFVTITIAPMTGGYSIMVNGGTNNGNYVGHTGEKNGMNFDTKAILNTISFESNATVIKSETAFSMRFNKTSGDTNMRFRYYKTGQQAVQLYKSATAVYNVMTDVNDKTMGTATGDGDYEEGTEITLTATANPGYEFVNWTDLEDQVVSTDAAYTFTVTEEVALIANFQKSTSTALDNASSAKAAIKCLENGVLIIEKNGIRYNAQGAVVE